MPTLSRDHRRLLEYTVAQARTIAVDGARKVLTDQYAVHHHEPWPHMTAEERELRNQLRAHGRQLGDRRDERRDAQEIDHLVQACAYEHWHRMLFARFLAENNLLLDADYGMAMSLDEVRELAREQNRDWLDIAAELAQKMLLAVFRPDDPVLRVSLPPETRQQLEDKLATLPAEIFRADDSLGWVYQFWQRDAKDQVDEELKHGVLADADRIPAKTQLFTEDYMVHFLLENTLGAWWTAKRTSEGKPTTLAGYTWTYLRLNDDGSPAAGTLDHWPGAARDLKVLDPSMGSGHFLVFALPILACMRREEEGLSLNDALASVLRENLFGLEIDARCAQIAAFNLALAAWRFAGEHFALPELNLACSGLGIHASVADWVKLAGEDGLAREEMRRLYSLFRDAPTLGSLIDPLRLRASVFTSGAARVVPLIEEALQQERSEDVRELAIAAQGVLAAFRILASRFTLVATNVPYLARGKQDPILAQYCAEFHSDAKTDLATCFLDRCLRFTASGGTVALVTPQSYLFQTYYKDLRPRILKSYQFQCLAWLGPGAFREISGEVVKPVLIAISNRIANDAWSFPAVDVSQENLAEDKARSLTSRPLRMLVQKAQSENPGSVITPEELGSQTLLAEFAKYSNGLQTGDYERFGRFFWELGAVDKQWAWFQSTTDRTKSYGGMEQVILWEGGEGEISRSESSVIRGRAAWGKRGVAISAMGELNASLYLGDLYDDNTVVLTPHNEVNLDALWCFCSSPEYPKAVRRIDRALKVRAALVSVPFDLAAWRLASADQFPEGFPAPHSDDPAQWLFSGDPTGSDYPLQVAVARLLGYQWPRQTGSTFPDCPALGADRLGRYADTDGIVPLNSVAGEASAAERLRELLADAYLGEWSATKLQELLGKWNSLDDWLRDGFFEEHCRVFRQRPFVWHVCDGRKDGFHSLVSYHKLAGTNGEGRQTLEKLIYTYLGDWISRQRADLATNAEGADGRLTAALHLKDELERILAGAPPYDIFVRWKPLHEQPIGWEPDINDGVRLTIRPWLATTLAPSTKPRKGACALRVTPRINYGKDRGKEPHRTKEDFPWFWSWDGQSDDFPGGKEFDGARWNDLHYSLETKQKARERKQRAGV